MGLTFGQVVDVLAEANTLAPDRRDRFISRLKQWQKMGFPAGVNVGKGTRANYGAKQLFQLAFHMRLLALGLTPERAQLLLNVAWSPIQFAITSMTVASATGDLGGHYLLVRVDALTDFREATDHQHTYVYPVLGSMLADALEPNDEGLSEDEIAEADEVRLTILDTMVDAIVIEVDSIVWRIWGAMTKLSISPETLTSEFQQWAQELGEHLTNDARKRPPRPPARTDNLASIRMCPACFAGRLLGAKQEHDHASDT